MQFAWGAVKEVTLKLYPDGNAKDTGAHEAALCLGVGRSLKPSAYMPKLTDSTAVTDAFGRCIDIVRDGRGALLHVRVIPVRPAVARGGNLLRCGIAAAI